MNDETSRNHCADAFRWLFYIRDMVSLEMSEDELKSKIKKGQNSLAEMYVEQYSFDFQTKSKQEQELYFRKYANQIMILGNLEMELRNRQ